MKARTRATAFGPPAGELWPGDVVDDRYAIEREVGRGGMGVVYLARDLSAKRLCALKEICAAMADRADVIERFQTEAKVLAQLNHPCIVRLYATGTHKGRPYIVMEWVEGRTLREVMQARRKPYDLVEALDIAIQIGSALMVAHRRGVIHRDLKPENVMLRKDASLKVLDWGLAKIRDGAATTNRLQALATPLYAAPEQYRRGGVDGRTDVYPLGLMFVEMATGRYAFADPDETLPSDRIAAEMHREAIPNRLIDWVAGCPETLSALIERAVAKDRRDRPHAAEFVDALVGEARALGALPEDEEDEEEAREDEGARRDTQELPASFRPEDPLARFRHAPGLGPRGTMKMESAASLLAKQGRSLEQARQDARADQEEVRSRPASLPPASAIRTVATAPLSAAPVHDAETAIPRPSLEAAVPRPSLEHARIVYALARRPEDRPKARARGRPVLLLALVGLFTLLGFSLWVSARWIREPAPGPSKVPAPATTSSATRSASDVH